MNFKSIHPRFQIIQFKCNLKYFSSKIFFKNKKTQKDFLVRGYIHIISGPEFVLENVKYPLTKQIWIPGLIGEKAHYIMGFELIMSWNRIMMINDH